MITRRSYAIARVVRVVAAMSATPVLAHAQDVTVDATLTAERVTEGATTTLRVTVETRGADAEINVRLPPELEVVGSQDFSQLQVINSATRTRQIRRDLVLRAMVAGRYTIGSVVIEVEGRTYTTDPLELVVEAGASSGGATSSRAPPDVQLRAWLDPDTVYVGQQIVLNAEALFAGDLRARQSRPASYEAPSPTGFWVQDLDTPITASARLIDGDVYEAQVFRRVYFPLEAGDFTIEPARLVYELRRGLLQPPESYELVSDSLEIVVNPLPQPAPPSFTGAVGRFSIQASLSPASIPVGGAATLTVELSGEGNVKALPPPILPELPEVEVFPPSEEASVVVVNDDVRGVKRFEWVIVPSAEAALDIGSIEYTFFDPGSGRYERTASSPLTLAVGPVTTPLGDPGGLRPLRPTPSGRSLAWVESPLFFALQALPLLLIGVTVVRGRGWLAGRDHRSAQRERIRDRSARLDALRTAALAGGSDFYVALDDTVRNAVADALDLPVERLTSRARMSALLRDQSPEAADALRAFLDHYDRARFEPTPATASDRVRLVAEARTVVDRVHRLGTGSDRNAGSAAATAIVLALVVAAPLEAHAQLPFQQGVDALERGDFEGAVHSFESHLEGRPHDANAWYDLGIAYYSEGRAGEAAWAWLNALRIEPRHADARINILAAGGAAYSLVPPAFIPARHEAILITAVMLWLGALLFSTQRLTESVRRAALAIVLVVGVLAAASMALDGMEGRAIVTLDGVGLLAGPTLRSDILQPLTVRTPVRIVQRQPGWTRVTVAGAEGWIEANALRSF